MFVELENNLIFDEWGYLINFNDWNISICYELAYNDGIEILTDEHFRIIYFLRDYFEQNNICPKVRVVLDSLGISLKYVYELFPFGLIQSAYKIAGLPKPNDCN